jgi:putative cardiolipin synthase
LIVFVFLEEFVKPGLYRSGGHSAALRNLCLAAALGLLSACASIDFDHPRSQSFALRDTGDTYLAREFAAELAAHPADQSGFFTLVDGIEALTARLLLAERAERSIDVQYYLIKTDTVSYAFIDSLLRAADRGVRVRLLLDDIFTKGYDAGMAGLDSHPNFEIRIYNPFGRAGGRGVSAITDFKRINRRMHNKSFTVDNQITIIGGRNIADEYFGARKDAKFGDLDVAGIGPVVQDVSAMFDSYWNHETALPVPAFAKMPEDPAAELERVRGAIEAARKRVAESKYAAAVQDKYLEFVESHESTFTWATYRLAYDSPDKGVKPKARDAASIRTPLSESLLSAKEELLIASPYFVPRKSGIKAFSEIVKGGVAVTVITNTLAANNQFTVHGGYAPARKPLLRNGIKLYEVRPDAFVSGAEIMAASGAKATLHTKAFIVDRREVFIGSFNFDPRSAYINTELGVIIRSPEIARALAEAVDANLAEQAYELFLNENGRLRWKGIEAGEPVIFTKEPQTTWGQRFMGNFMRIMPIRSQL